VDTDKEEKKSARNLQGKGGLELLIDHSQPEGRNGK
jgi:hypothetical protein